MSRFDALGASSGSREAEEGPPFYVVSGVFACQFCEEQSPEARFMFTMKLLVWECERGHKSYIEDFNMP